MADTPPPTPEDMARSAEADLATWGQAEEITETAGDRPLARAIAYYIALARVALPAWIRRCVAAEARVKALGDELAAIRPEGTPKLGSRWRHKETGNERQVGMLSYNLSLYGTGFVTVNGCMDSRYFLAHYEEVLGG